MEYIVGMVASSFRECKIALILHEKIYRFIEYIERWEKFL
ncbi:hypothetical protein SELSPUOL_02539 [Selenomonas sputigena ATCC 35185]|uniref:Uncharacterized protein n=1 Tax=Selenomonas sputigena (strain ATCC 35185 / DSM 20758 / CCUG 44933 / VPI D19B-28) TaxID=546271 RepID=C9LYH9_SELS3|nr:hypothetical protein SELSPUOL_02539 [Selenomonas sputigena ATCC 35185]